MEFLDRLDGVIDKINRLFGDEAESKQKKALRLNDDDEKEEKIDGGEKRTFLSAMELAKALQEKRTEFLVKKNFRKVRSGTPRCVLVVDGGGLKGHMSIQILKKLEEKLKTLKKREEDEGLKLYQAFDLIMGTSTGGLISIGLGKLKMSCDEIDGLYQEVADSVFSTHSSDKPVVKQVETAGSNVKRFVRGKIGYFADTVDELDTNELEKIIKKMVGNYDTPDHDPEAPMYSPGKSNDETKCGVVTTLCNNYQFQNAVIIRSYDIVGEITRQNKNKNKNKNEIKNRNQNQNKEHFDCGYSECDPQFFDVLPGIHECKIWEAARATSAALPYFKDMFIDMPKELAINVIKRNLCHAIGIGKNPITALYDFSLIYMPNEKISDVLNDYGKKIYQLLPEIKKENKRHSIVDGAKEFFVQSTMDKKMDKMVQEFNDAVENTWKIDGEVEPNDYKRLTNEEFKEKICVPDDYRLRFEDGGISANSPIMAAFADATRLWPNSDIYILSIGTGSYKIKNFYVHGSTDDLLNKSNVGRSLTALFDAKDTTSWFTLRSFCQNKQMGVHLVRMDPEVPDKSQSTGADLLDMANADNMKEWGQIGQQYAQDHEIEINRWADFLYENYLRKQKE